MLTYTATRIGTIVLNGELCEIRQGNCLAVIVYFYTDKDGTDMVRLINFFSDEQHLKNILKGAKDIFFGEKVDEINLNTYYKEARTLLKYATYSGHTVKAFYEEPGAKTYGKPGCSNYWTEHK